MYICIPTGNTTGEYAQCGLVSVHDISENVREGEAADAPRFTFHVRSFAARFVSQDLIEVVAADNPRIANLAQPPALFFLYLCRGHATRVGGGEGGGTWTLSSCRSFLKSGPGAGEVEDPAAVAYVPTTNALVVLDRGMARPEIYRLRVMELDQESRQPTGGEAMRYLCILELRFKGYSSSRAFWTPMAVNENMDIVVAMQFEIRKWNIKCQLARQIASQTREKYAPHSWAMKRKAAYLPDNLFIGETHTEYECGGIVFDDRGLIIMNNWSGEHTSIIAAEPPLDYEDTGHHHVKWMVGGSKRKQDWVCGKKLSTRLFVDASQEGPAALCFLPAGAAAAGGAGGAGGEAAEGGALGSIVVADNANRRVVLLHVPLNPKS
jgi:hypothetical protein